mgnify:CR=1 FL=1
MNSKGGFDMEYMKKEVEIKEKIYNIEEKLEVNKLKEYIIKYLIKNKIANLDKNCHERIEEYSIFPLDLKKKKFQNLKKTVKKKKKNKIYFFFF